MDTCIVCLRMKSAEVTDSVPSFINAKNCSQKMSHIYCRIFNVDDENFAKYNIFFCDDCLTNVKKLNGLYSQLERIEKSIQNVFKETKIKILLSNIEAKSRLTVQNTDCSIDLLKYEYFRNKAIKDLNPTVHLRRVSSKIIANCGIKELDCELLKRKNKVKEENENFDEGEDEQLLLIQHDEWEANDHDIKTENDETVAKNHNSDLNGLVPGEEEPSVTNQINGVVEGRRTKRNKNHAEAYNKEDGTNEDLDDYSSQVDISDSENQTESHQDGLASRKQTKRRRGEPSSYKCLYRELQNQSDSSNCEYQCEKCLKVFVNKQCVKGHIRRVHLGDKIKLTADGKVLTKKGKVKKRFSCPAINLGGGKWSYKNFKYTKNISSGQCQCDLCGKYYDNPSGIQAHINRSHGISEEQFKNFTTAGKIRKVNRTRKLGDDERSLKGVTYTIEQDPDDETRKLYRCGICQFVCKVCPSIQRHIYRQHLNPEIRECSFCGKKFSSKMSFDEHLLSHKNDKSATCEECGQTFKYKTGLYAHRKRIHLGERPYICEFCGKRFFTKKDCRVHSATHVPNN